MTKIRCLDAVFRKTLANSAFDKRQKEKKASTERRVQQSLENLIPKQLTSYPDFPKESEGDTKIGYAAKIDEYWTNQRKRKLTEDQPDQNSDPMKKRKMEDFSEEEQNVVYDQRVLLSVSKETVAEMNDTDVGVINEIISDHNIKQQIKNANFKVKKIKNEDEKEEALKMIGTFNCDLCQVKCPGMDFFSSWCTS